MRQGGLKLIVKILAKRAGFEFLIRRRISESMLRIKECSPMKKSMQAALDSCRDRQSPEGVTGVENVCKKRLIRKVRNTIRCCRSAVN